MLSQLQVILHQFTSCSSSSSSSSSSNFDNKGIFLCAGTRSLMHQSQVYGVSENTHLVIHNLNVNYSVLFDDFNSSALISFFSFVNKQENMEGERIVRRMGIELNDYPGSGANKRHTPNPKP